MDTPDTAPRRRGRPPGARDKAPRRITPKESRRRAAAILKAMAHRKAAPDPAYLPYDPDTDRLPAPCRMSRTDVTRLHVLHRHWTEAGRDEGGPPVRRTGHRLLLVDVLDAVLTAGFAALMPAPGEIDADPLPAALDPPAGADGD